MFSWPGATFLCHAAVLAHEKPRGLLCNTRGPHTGGLAEASGGIPQSPHEPRPTCGNTLRSSRRSCIAGPWQRLPKWRSGRGRYAIVRNHTAWLRITCITRISLLLATTTPAYRATNARST